MDLYINNVLWQYLFGSPTILCRLGNCSMSGLPVNKLVIISAPLLAIHGIAAYSTSCA